jgi:hypothetical protein
MRMLVLMLITATAWSTEWTKPKAPESNPRIALERADSDGAAAEPAAVAVKNKQEQDPTLAHVRDLEQKIAKLESSLGRGRGAYKQGATLRIDGGEHETVLERMHRFELEVAASKVVIDNRDEEIAALRGRLEAVLAQNEALSERLDTLNHARESLETAQQELADRQRKLGELGDQLAVSELARLRIERLYYLLAAQVIRLSPSHTQEIIELQDEVREQAKELDNGAAASGER